MGTAPSLVSCVSIYCGDLLSLLCSCVSFFRLSYFLVRGLRLMAVVLLTAWFFVDSVALFPRLPGVVAVLSPGCPLVPD